MIYDDLCPKSDSCSDGVTALELWNWIEVSIFSSEKRQLRVVCRDVLIWTSVSEEYYL